LSGEGAVGLKEEIDNLIASHGAKIQERERLSLDFEGAQRRRFGVLRRLLEDLRNSVEARHLTLAIHESSARLKIGKLDQPGPGEILLEIGPNYEVVAGSSKDGPPYRLADGFRLEETHNDPMFGASQTILLKFETVDQLFNYVVENLSQKIAEIENMESPAVQENLFDEACNWVAKGHTQNGDSPLETLNRLFKQNMTGKAPEPIPFLTEKTTETTLQKWENTKLHDLIKTKDGEESDRGIHAPPVVAIYNEHRGLLDGNKRTRWRHNRDDQGPHAVLVIKVLNGIR
jgi:hypothetical protein